MVFVFASNTNLWGSNMEDTGRSPAPVEVLRLWGKSAGWDFYHCGRGKLNGHSYLALNCNSSIRLLLLAAV